MGKVERHKATLRSCIFAARLEGRGPGWEPSQSLLDFNWQDRDEAVAYVDEFITAVEERQDRRWLEVGGSWLEGVSWLLEGMGYEWGAGGWRRKEE